jgi:hypothetical protein
MGESEVTAIKPLFSAVRGLCDGFCEATGLVFGVDSIRRSA